MMFNIFAANSDSRGSKLQEEAVVDFEDFKTRCDGLVFKIKYIDYRNAIHSNTTNHTYPDYMITFSRLINEIELCHEIYAFHNFSIFSIQPRSSFFL